MKGKRAQAAMEFLMTYGWAILIILVAIAALAYFGVLNPARYVADRCTLPVPMVCDDFTVTNAGGISVRMTNGDVKDIRVTSASAIGFGTGCVFSGPPVDIPQGQSAIISITACSPAVNPDKIKSDLVITYTSGSPSLTKTITGEIYSRVN